MQESGRRKLSNAHFILNFYSINTDRRTVDFITELHEERKKDEDQPMNVSITTLLHAL